MLTFDPKIIRKRIPCATCLALHLSIVVTVANAATKGELVRPNQLNSNTKVGVAVFDIKKNYVQSRLKTKGESVSLSPLIET